MNKANLWSLIVLVCQLKWKKRKKMKSEKGSMVKIYDTHERNCLYRAQYYIQWMRNKQEKNVRSKAWPNTKKLSITMEGHGSTPTYSLKKYKIASME